VSTGRVCGPCSQPENKGVQNDTHVHRLWTRASFWTLVFMVCGHVQRTRVVCTLCS